MAPEIYSSRESVVQIDGKEVDGIQSIDWKENRQRTDVYGTGEDLRIGVEYGVKLISGTIRVKSSINALDVKLKLTEVTASKFDMIITLKKTGGVGTTPGEASANGPTFTFTFDQCYVDSVERSMDVNGVAISTYLFTASNVIAE
jgi:hypothetical protein